MWCSCRRRRPLLRRRPHGRYLLRLLGPSPLQREIGGQEVGLGPASPCTWRNLLWRNAGVDREGQYLFSLTVSLGSERRVRIPGRHHKRNDL